jgi:hypothetical protein
MFERAEWLSKMSTRLVESSGKTTESQDALLSLIAQLEQRPSAFASPVSADRDDEDRAGLDDSPAKTDTDALGFYSHVKALGRVIDGATTPLTVGVFGTWGSGKTSFLRMMQEYMADEGQYETIWINAWGTSATPLELLVEGLGTIFTGSRKVEELQGSVQRKHDAQAVRADIVELVTSLMPPDKRIAVFIDDLDRCAPARQVEFLDVIAGAFNIEPLVTVVAADRDVLLQAVRPRYRGLLETPGDELREDLGEDFLERVIDISFMIPVSDSRTAVAMMGGLLTAETSHKLGRLAYFLDPTPRKLKRFLNTYRLVLVLAKQSNPDLNQEDEELLARMTLLGSRWPALLGDPVRLVKLWRASSDHDVEQRSEALNSAIEELKLLDTEALIAFFEQEPLPSQQQVEMTLPLLRRVMPIPPAR